MNVPLLDLSGQYAGIKQEIDAAILRVVESQRFVMGPEVEALERRIAEYCRTEYAVSCGSGTDALLLALMAHRVGPGDEVICPPYSFFATASSITRLGAIPVFVDIEPDTYNIDPRLVAERARECKRLRAIMPVHLYGRCADMEALLEQGRRLNVPVVEDAAQAIGARDAQGKTAGSRGSIGCFSFYPSKNLGAYGDGGMLTTNDPILAERLAMLRVHGEVGQYRHERVGICSRLDALQAAVLNVKLRYLDDWTRKRRANAEHYDRMFEVSAAVRIPPPASGQSWNIYNQYVIRVSQELRDPLRKHLAEQGIGTAIYYPIPLHLQECFEYLGYSCGDLPHAEAAAKETLALPIYPELTREQLDVVASAVVEYLGANTPAAQSV